LAKWGGEIFLSLNVSPQVMIEYQTFAFLGVLVCSVVDCQLDSAPFQSSPLCPDVKLPPRRISAKMMA